MVASLKFEFRTWMRSSPALSFDRRGLEEPP